MKTVFRFFLTLSLCCSASVAAAQQTVQINFQKYTPGDLDLILKEVLEYNGYRVNVAYTPEEQERDSSDYTINYSIEIKRELVGLKYTLLQKGEIVNTVQKNENLLRLSIRATLSKLFDTSMRTENNKVYSIPQSITKLGDGEYILNVRSKYKKTKKAEEEFFATAGKLMPGFYYYMDSGIYGRDSSEQIYTFNTFGGGLLGAFAGVMMEPVNCAYAFGYIRRNSDGEIVRLEEVPEALEGLQVKGKLPPKEPRQEKVKLDKHKPTNIKPQKQDKD